MIDLHCHSLYSDGTDSPSALAQAAHTQGLKALALTDHDTLAGLPTFMACQPKCSTRLIPGIELSCRFIGMELHILGLFLDLQDEQLHERVLGLGRRREERNRRMMERLGDIGIQMDWEDVKSHAGAELVSRAHFARALHRLGFAGSPQDAFKRIIGEGCPGHVPFQELQPAEACRWIREAKGVPVVAHPGRSANRNFRWDQAMADLKAMGICGFETYYADYSPTEERYFLKLALELDMARSGGSDYHGATKPGISLGTGRGSLAIPDDVLNELEGWCER
ncbi:PHP domain-containing protein [Holophaga foetida]|uniref:PHP domain-containing protein n=1 Tax=Holophaga foetida TaxID=35839 RepID=UPI0002473AC7|nr:PHP domain-containing protein [Holophaga foetida]